MDTLKDIVAYFTANYPYPNELSKARLTKMVYLADWKSAIDYGKQATDILWYFDNYGPFKPDVYNIVAANPELFQIDSTNTMFGDRKNVLRIRDKAFIPNLSDSVKHLLDHVISETKTLNWTQFISLVYGTFPIVVSPRYTELDLVALASQYEATARTLQTR